MYITELNQTCGACPSQWEGKLNDGRMFYIRYRWGYLSVRISENATNDVGDAVGGQEILGEQVDKSGWDGVMNEDDMLEKIKSVLKLGDDENE